MLEIIIVISSLMGLHYLSLRAIEKLLEPEAKELDRKIKVEVEEKEEK